MGVLNGVVVAESSQASLMFVQGLLKLFISVVKKMTLCHVSTSLALFVDSSSTKK